MTLLRLVLRDAALLTFLAVGIPSGFAQSTQNQLGETIEDIYEGANQGGSVLRLLVISLDKNKYAISVTSSGPGPCEGRVSGFGAGRGASISFASLEDRRYKTCKITLTWDGSHVTIAEQPGCADYHGVACEFSGTVARRAE